MKSLPLPQSPQEQAPTNQGKPKAAGSTLPPANSECCLPLIKLRGSVRCPFATPLWRNVSASPSHFLESSSISGWGTTTSILFFFLKERVKLSILGHYFTVLLIVYYKCGPFWGLNKMLQKAESANEQMSSVSQILIKRKRIVFTKIDLRSFSFLFQKSKWGHDNEIKYFLNLYCRCLSTRVFQNQGHGMTSLGSSDTLGSRDDSKHW